MFRGLHTALITPFKNGELDLDAYKRLLEHQAKAGVSGVVVCGTTGETPTLNDAEQRQLISIATDMLKPKGIKVIAGASSMSTEGAIALAKRNESLGVDGVLVAVPPYNKPSQNGLMEHFTAIAKAIKCPLILYNVPGRTVAKLENKTVVELSKVDNIVALKDATGDLSLVAELRSLLGEDFDLLSGNDATTVGFNAMGGNGSIAVISNIAPELCVKLQKATETNDYETARQIQSQLAHLNKILYLEANPIPVKYACSLLGYGDASVRLPLTTLAQEHREKIKTALITLDLIKE